MKVTLRANPRSALALAFAGVLAGCGGAGEKPAESPSSASPSTGASTPEKGTGSRAPEGKETGKLPSFCGDGSGYCERVRATSSLEVTRAMRELSMLDDEDKSRPEALVELASRTVESESFAYGTGGDAARRGKVLLLEAEKRKSSPHALLLLAQIELALGDAPGAGRRLTALRREFPLEAEIHGALGVSLLAQGKVEASLEPLGRATVLDPKSAERKLVLGSARMLFGDNVGAEAAFREALEISPNSFKAKSDLGSVLLVLGRVEEGRDFLNAAADLEPTRATVHSNLAYANLLLGENKLALECAERATRLDPELGSAWLNLGLAKARAKNYRGAREAFEKARSLDPTDPRALENLTELDALEKR